MNEENGTYNNDVPWPSMSTPRTYFQTSNFIVAPGVCTLSSQRPIYQMQFNSSSYTFYLYLLSVSSPESEELKN
jgi:hypothetical protein